MQKKSQVSILNRLQNIEKRKFTGFNVTEIFSVFTLTFEAFKSDILSHANKRSSIKNFHFSKSVFSGNIPFFNKSQKMDKTNTKNRIKLYFGKNGNFQFHSLTETKMPFSSGKLQLACRKHKICKWLRFSLPNTFSHKRRFSAIEICNSPRSRLRKKLETQKIIISILLLKFPPFKVVIPKTRLAFGDRSEDKKTGYVTIAGVHDYEGNHLHETCSCQLQKKIAEKLHPYCGKAAIGKKKCIHCLQNVSLFCIHDYISCKLKPFFICLSMADSSCN